MKDPGKQPPAGTGDEAATVADAAGGEELIWLGARRQRQLLDQGELSAVELMKAHYTQIERVNPRINALVNLLPRDQAMQLAEKADTTLSRTEPNKPLHGLPMAPKDTVDAAGFPTTFGFVPFSARVADRDSSVIARQRAAGALFIGKSNTPEFALGSHTYNSLFGTTANPYDHDRTAGGSSGGAAAAIASGMLSVADGSDMGGSLRNPASFCNVVGFRPSIGRIPDERPFGWLARLATAGPLARTVEDAAWLFSVQAGADPADPLTLSEPGSSFRDPPAAHIPGLRLACSVDLGHLPVDPEVAAICTGAAQIFEDLGARVAGDHPNLDAAMDVFQIQRAAVLTTLGHTLDQSVPDWRDHAKDSVIWNIDKGLQLHADDLINSEIQRTTIYRDVSDFFQRYDALLLPAAQVPPFPADLDWVREINGQPMATYIDWMTVCCAISITGLPTISVPAGFTASGLPIGLQIVGRPRGDFELLQIARAFEAATGHASRRPDLSRLAG